MKWYNIKKFMPVVGMEMLIRAVINNEHLKYDRYFVASLDDLRDIEQLENWEISNGQILDIEMDRYQVTHFCVFEPIGIEE